MLYQCIAIGAGASGLFFAATRNSSGAVLLLDRQERPGRKILLSGGGKCNVTNRSVSPANYLGANPLFSREALRAFTPKLMLDFLREQNIAIEERDHGQIFCKTGAEALRNALVNTALQNGAEFGMGQTINAIKRHHGGDARFVVETAAGSYRAKNILISCGGPAWPRSGASFLGKKIAQDFGHNYLAPRPALSPLKMPKNWSLHGLQGISVLAAVSAASGPKFTLPLLFTHSGISGPACLQASSYLCLNSAAPLTAATTSGRASSPKPNVNLKAPAAKASAGRTEKSAPAHPDGTANGANTKLGNGEPEQNNNCGELFIDFLPGHALEQLIDAPENAKQNPLAILRRLLPERLAQALLSTPECVAFKERKNAELPRLARKALAQAVHEHRATPLPPGFEQAESSSGGIDTAEINPKTMESRLVPGLYFTGEVLDICGQLGGYNLHWAWASAWLAGRHI